MKKRLAGFALALIMALGWAVTARADLGGHETLIRPIPTSTEIVIEPCED